MLGYRLNAEAMKSHTSHKMVMRSRNQCKLLTNLNGKGLSPKTRFHYHASPPLVFFHALHKLWNHRSRIETEMRRKNTEFRFLSSAFAALWICCCTRLTTPDKLCNAIQTHREQFKRISIQNPKKPATGIEPEQQLSAGERRLSGTSAKRATQTKMRMQSTTNKRWTWIKWIKV